MVRKLGWWLDAEQNSSIGRGNPNWHRSYDRGQPTVFYSGQALRPRNPQNALSFFVLVGAIPFCCSANLNVVQSRHNNICNNVKFATCFGYK